MIDRLTRDNLIDLLDEDGKLFQDIRLKRHGGKPVLLHKGRNSEIYDMYCPDVADEGHKKEYILKVTYYDKGDRASIAYADSLWNQRRMGNFSKYVVHIEKIVRISKNNNIIVIKFVYSNPLYVFKSFFSMDKATITRIS